MCQADKVVKVISIYKKGKVTMYQISTVLDKRASTAHLQEDQFKTIEAQAQRGLCKIEYKTK